MWRGMTRPWHGPAIKLSDCKASIARNAYRPPQCSTLPRHALPYPPRGRHLPGALSASTRGPVCVKQMESRDMGIQRRLHMHTRSSSSHLPACGCGPILILVPRFCQAHRAEQAGLVSSDGGEELVLGAAHTRSAGAAAQVHAPVQRALLPRLLELLHAEVSGARGQLPEVSRHTRRGPLEGRGVRVPAPSQGVLPRHGAGQGRRRALPGRGERLQLLRGVCGGGGASGQGEGTREED